MNPIELYQRLFEGDVPEFKHFLQVVKVNEQATLETDGPTLLDREVSQADLTFMKQLTLNNMEVILPPIDGDETVQAVFRIRDKENNSILSFSNRGGTNGELRGERLIQALEEKKKTSPQETLYTAIAELYDSKPSQSMFFTYMTNGFRNDEGDPPEEETKTFLREMVDDIYTHIKKEPSLLSIDSESLSDEEIEHFSSIAKKCFSNSYANPEILNTTPIQRFGKTLGFGFICLAATIAAAALIATGVGAILGVPLLYLAGAAFAAGLLSATKIVSEEKKHSNEVDILYNDNILPAQEASELDLNQSVNAGKSVLPSIPGDIEEIKIKYGSTASMLMNHKEMIGAGAGPGPTVSVALGKKTVSTSAKNNIIPSKNDDDDIIRITVNPL